MSTTVQCTLIFSKVRPRHFIIVCWSRALKLARVRSEQASRCLKDINARISVVCLFCFLKLDIWFVFHSECHICINRDLEIQWVNAGTQRAETHQLLWEFAQVALGKQHTVWEQHSVLLYACTLHALTVNTTCSRIQCWLWLHRQLSFVRVIVCEPLAFTLPLHHLLYKQFCCQQLPLTIISIIRLSLLMSFSSH